MKKLIYLGIACLFLIGGQAHAQTYIFKILANKGDNAYKTSQPGADWQPLRTGASLNQGDMVRVAEGAYVGLIHSSGKTHEITTEGNYNVDDLASSLTSGNTGVAAKYADFVLTKMSEEDEDISENYGQYVNATGAVERATNSSALPMMLNKSSKVYSDEIILRWAEGDPEESYTVTLYNIFDKVIKEQEVEESTLLLDFNDEKLQGQQFVKVKVQVTGNDTLVSDQYGIERLAPGRTQSITEEWAALQGEVQEESPLNYIIKAGFFEEKELYLDALTAYEKAIKLAPEVDSFRQMYQEFLVRTNLAGPMGEQNSQE